MNRREILKGLVGGACAAPFVVLGEEENVLHTRDALKLTLPSPKEGVQDVLIKGLLEHADISLNPYGKHSLFLRDAHVSLKDLWVELELFWRHKVTYVMNVPFPFEGSRTGAWCKHSDWNIFDNHGYPCYLTDV